MAQAQPFVFSVRALTRYVRTVLERDRTLRQVLVRGEISNFVAHSSGHLYFSLKDEFAQLRCVMFRERAAHLAFDPADGMSVIASGAITVYEPRGQYQLSVDEIYPEGLGALFLAFEQLKARLGAEGLFDPARRRPLPSFPCRVAVVTSPDGAVFHDIVRVMRRRWPAAGLVLVPSMVSGVAAAPSLVSAIATAGALPDVEVVIVARGGGSIEELAPFNDESVARAIAACPVPVVTGIGHETDVTIADFVADLRAPTPSAAAELVAPDRGGLRLHLAQLEQRAGRGLRHRVRTLERELDLLSRRPVLASSAGVLSQPRQWLDELWGRSRSAAESRLRGLGHRLDLLGHRGPLVWPAGLFAGARGLVGALERRAVTAVRSDARRRRERLASLRARAEALSPRAVLGRGYSIVLRLPQRSLVRVTRDIAAGDRAEVLLSDGSARIRVEDVRPEGEG